MGRKATFPPCAATQSTATPAGKRICVARIGAAHGTRGEVRLWSFTADPRAVAAYGPLMPADGAQAIEIEALRPAKGCYVARLKGVTDRAAAERLRNVDLYIPRERLPVPQREEFYHADLIGLAAEDAEGNVLGAVAAVHNFGAGDLLEIALQGSARSVMLPFTVAAVPRIDIATGRIIVNAPAELMDTTTPADPERPGERSPRDGAGS